VVETGDRVEEVAEVMGGVAALLEDGAERAEDGLEAAGWEGVAEAIIEELIVASTSKHDFVICDFFLCKKL